MIATLTKNDKTILSAIRNKAHYGGQIVLVNYYSHNTAALDSSHRNSVTPPSRRRLKPFHVEIADAFDAFAAAAAHSGGDPCTAGLLTQLSTGGCGIHPSYAGQAVLAQAVEKAIHIS